MVENRPGAGLKRLVLYAIAIGITLAAAYATHWTRINLEREEQWAPFIKNQDAELRRLGFRSYMATVEQDRITVQPHPDGAVHVIEMPGPRWEYVYYSAFLVFALLAAGIFVWRAGKELIWYEGQWVPVTANNDDFATHPAGYIEVRYGSTYRRSGISWLVLSAVMVVLASESIITAVPAIAFFCVVLAVMSLTWSRRVCMNAQGLHDSSLFSNRRIPWAAVAGMEHVDINRRRWDKARKGRGLHRSPQGSHWVHLITDHEGREVLRLSEDMAPGDRFKALLERIEKRIQANATQSGAE